MKKRLIETVFNWATALGGLMLLSATFMTGADVLSRWLLSSPLRIAVEYTALAIGLGTLLGLPTCLAERGNVSAKLISEFLPKSIARVVDLLGTVLSLALMAFILWIATHTAWQKINSYETTPDMGLPLGPSWVAVVVVLALCVVGAVRGVFRKSSDGDEI